MSNNIKKVLTNGSNGVSLFDFYAYLGDFKVLKVFFFNKKMLNSTQTTNNKMQCKIQTNLHRIAGDRITN